MSTLQGADGLRRRFNAIRHVLKTSGHEWASETTRYAERHVPIRTGATRASIRPGVVTPLRATVVGKYTINFIDAGSKAHDEPRSRFTKTGRLRRGKSAGTGKVLKFEAGGQTVFARKVHKRAIPPHRFKKASGIEGLRKLDPLGDLVTLWNQAD